MRCYGLVQGILTVLTAVASGAEGPQPPEAAGRIAGIVMEMRSGTPDVVVILCDQETGIPLSAATKRPFIEDDRRQGLPELLTAVSDRRGRFAFEGLPEGRYRLVAQKWSGPFKGVFEIHGTVIQLFGWADEVRVPSPEAEKVVLTPPGDRVLRLDQDAPNSETLLVLSTRPPAGDPILGFLGLGKGFLAHAIGCNRMPYGRTTVVGLPPGKVHAFLFAADNRPGFATATYEARPLPAAERVPFVAFWSDARHEPPPRIREVIEQIDEHGLDVGPLVGIEPGREPQDRLQTYLRLSDELDRKVDLPGAETATVGELLAADAYKRLLKEVEQRKQP